MNLSWPPKHSWAGHLGAWQAKETPDEETTAWRAVGGTNPPGATKSPGAILDSEAGPTGANPKEGVSNLNSRRLAPEGESHGWDE